MANAPAQAPLGLRLASSTSAHVGGEPGETLTLKETGHVLQLRDVVLLVAAVFLQQGENAVVLAAGVRRVQGLQLPEHFAPRGLLVLRVLHLWDRLPAARKLDDTFVEVIVFYLSLFV